MFSIIGLSDGLTVPFALAAGLSSLGESRIVALGGVAELFAGAISMGIGGFLASQAERDHYRYLQHHTAQRVHHICAGEMEREVAEVLGPVGVDEQTCRAVAQSLWSAEEAEDSFPSETAADEENVKLISKKEVGLTAFLLKLGQGMGKDHIIIINDSKLTDIGIKEEIPNKRMYISAFTIGMGYLFGGIIPLLPYFFIPRAQVALIYSTIITGIVLLIFGAVKAWVTGAAQSLAGYIWGAVSILMVGGMAAAAAFGIARVMKGGGV